MRTLTLLTCLSGAVLLSACGYPDYGYYDANGNYVPAPNATTEAQRVRSPSPGQPHHDYYRDRYDNTYYGDRRVVETTTTYTYDRPGYYDYNGYYVGERGAFNVPRGMFPPRGMCRVWFPDRLPENQPPVETCVGIRDRVPAGAYVVYGG